MQRMSVMVVGCMDYVGGVWEPYFCPENLKMNAQVFVELLDSWLLLTAKHRLEGRWTLQMDNAPSHCKKHGRVPA